MCLFSEKLLKQKAVPKSLQNGSGFRRFVQRFQDGIQNADPLLKVDEQQNVFAIRLGKFAKLCCAVRLKNINSLSLGRRMFQEPELELNLSVGS